MKQTKKPIIRNRKNRSHIVIYLVSKYQYFLVDIPSTDK